MHELKKYKRRSKEKKNDKIKTKGELKKRK